MTDEDYKGDRTAVARQWCNHSCRPMIREHALGRNTSAQAKLKKPKRTFHIDWIEEAEQEIRVDLVQVNHNLQVYFIRHSFHVTLLIMNKSDDMKVPFFPRSKSYLSCSLRWSVRKWLTEKTMNVSQGHLFHVRLIEMTAKETYCILIIFHLIKQWILLNIYLSVCSSRSSLCFNLLLFMYSRIHLIIFLSSLLFILFLFFLSPSLALSEKENKRTVQFHRSRTHSS